MQLNKKKKLKIFTKVTREDIGSLKYFNSTFDV